MPSPKIQPPDHLIGDLALLGEAFLQAQLPPLGGQVNVPGLGTATLAVPLHGGSQLRQLGLVHLV